MMMIPRKHDFDLWDEMFRDPFFTESESKLMKTDIKEKKDKYVIDIDLPGYEKDGIKVEIQDGYLTVHAKVDKSEDDSDDLITPVLLEGCGICDSLNICRLDSCLTHIDGFFESHGLHETVQG